MGLAFEIHDSVARKKKLEKEDDKSADLQLESDLRSIDHPSATDVFHYAFCHAGILTGNIVVEYLIIINLKSRPFVKPQ